MLATVGLAGCGQKQATPDASASNGATSSPGAGCNGSTDTLTLNIAIAAPIATIGVGQKVGIFAKHCLTIVETDSTSPPPALAAVIGGSADITYLPAVNVVTSVAKGIPIRVIAPNASFPANAATQPPERIDGVGVFPASGVSIARPKDLEGKTVSIPGRGAQLEMSVAAAVANDGGDPKKINWVTLDQPTALQQLKAGKIQAAELTAPFTQQAEQAGFKRVMSPTLSIYAPGTTYLMWVTTANTLSSKMHAMQDFRDAVLEINQYTLQHQDVYQQVLSDRTKVPLAAVQAGPDLYLGTDVTESSLNDVAARLLSLGYVDHKPDLTNVIVSFN
jgi:NitT/TauT family transport system substrate-binding protein